ncbi:unnamed protein product [Choristocarpus tenellus]
MQGTKPIEGFCKSISTYKMESAPKKPRMQHCARNDMVTSSKTTSEGGASMDRGGSKSGDSPTTYSTTIEARLKALRLEMEALGVSSYLVGSEDAHQSEYVSDHDKRREWVSGFTGSAGTALVTKTKALLWTDGRYFLQARQQLSSSWSLMRIGEPKVPSLEDWVAQGGVEDYCVGVDPWLIGTDASRTLGNKLEAVGGMLVPIYGNLVDKVWIDQPMEPCCPVKMHPLELAGVSVPEKLASIRKLVCEEGASSLVIMALDEIAWLFNIRGNDVSFNPVAIASALLTQDRAFLFINEAKLQKETKQHLSDEHVTIRPYSALLDEIRALKMSSSKPPSQGDPVPQGRVLIDPHVCLAVRLTIPDGMALECPSPVALAKAIKNPCELEGLRNAHLRDGVALTSFLAWLERAVGLGEEGGGDGVGWPITECTAAEKLEEFRKTQAGYVCPSFETISGYGPNGSIIHYCAPKETARAIGTDNLFLLDSGAQYKDGTTDVTRTLHFGTPTAHHRRCFTLVLKGHIALARAVFPENTMGSKLDVLARTALWEVGLDYQHGTGHGVGAFLNVHEGPHGIHYYTRPNEQGIQIGMTTSNEPGYYEDGEFGLRIESVCICVEKKTDFTFAGRRRCTFETITWAPIQNKLIDVSMLTEVEREWLDNYHAKVRSNLLPLMCHNQLAQEYLLRETEPLVCN